VAETREIVGRWGREEASVADLAHPERRYSIATVSAACGGTRCLHVG
jgi:hypothetical protein